MLTYRCELFENNHITIYKVIINFLGDIQDVSNITKD